MAPRIDPVKPTIDPLAPEIAFRVQPGAPFYEVRVASHPELFLDDRRAERSAENYWTTRANGVAAPSRGEDTVRVPTEAARRITRAGSLYYLLVAYADEQLGAPSYSMGPRDAVEGRAPRLDVVSPLSGGRRPSLLSTLTPPTEGAPSGDGSRGGGLLWAQQTPAEALDRRAKVSKDSSARIEFLDLNLVRGGDGKEHLYYLTTGGKGQNASSATSTFELKITNTNSTYNFKNPKLKVRLRSASLGTIPLAGQGKKDYKTIPSDDLEDESSRRITLHLDAATRRAAYDESSPLTFLDVEYHWEEGIGNHSYHYNRDHLGFYLVAPVNFLLSKAKHVTEVRFDDRKEHFKYWVHLTEKRFSERDQLPVQIEGTIQAQVTDATTGSINVTSSTTRTVGTERSEAIETSSEISAGVKDFLGTGIDLGGKFGVKGATGFKWTSSTATQFTEAYSTSKMASRSLTTTRRVSQSLAPSPAGTTAVLYAYPVFDLVEVPVVQYGGANAAGQATTRSVIDSFPLLVLKSWGFLSLVLDDGKQIIKERK